MADGPVVLVGRAYRAGPGGVRVTLHDGTVVDHAPGKVLVFSKEPKSVEGDLIALGGPRPRIETKT